MDAVKTRAPAKLNLTLEVGNKREDGYHLLTSVMVHISLYDELMLERCDGGIEFESNAVYLKNDDKNLCVLAAKRFYEAAGISGEGVRIRLKKLIPSNSGMGGGSADAAAVIELMERLYGGLDEETRTSVALSLGADVPFCMTKTSSLCEGIGERITPVSQNSRRLYVVVAKNSQKLSTAKVYSDYDASPSVFDGSHGEVIRALESGNYLNLKDAMANSFEKNIFEACPEVRALREKMLSLGAFASRMTGAGPTVFGIFEKRVDAMSALEALRREKILSYFAYIV
ncbi:MAG: 4-(cytidine 5'-diphospho)-2-C-methyl-D-erythritol kinase [Clostridia bacterium]|nr:4-(cytidine 5'-diphospho)-2-C-methyl-D-erythritol kinase [Clostridia bacterium]